MKIVIAGGSGQVGTILARAFHARGDEVTVLSRNPAKALWRVAPWDAETRGHWAQHIDGADVVINMAGRSVNCRYDQANKDAIMHSRVASTRVIGGAIREAARPPRVWLQASTATIYAHRYDAPNDEYSHVLGGPEPDAPAAWRFSVDVARAWEMALTAATTPATRKIAMRAAVIMSPDRGGPFDILLALVRRGLGGKSGNGRQYVSWIHDDDFVRAVDWLIEHDDVSGPVNLASPHPLPNAEFMRELRRAWGARFGLPATKWMLELGAWLMRTETELVLKSRRVVPAVLLRSGFEFKFPQWPEAARDLVKRWRVGESKKAIP
jgi:uncharacterized protein